ncbi:hypothetical protein [Streptomyces sp. NBC_00358]|uniref:hypothetical protein n=1 Tax=Streptomyces sp. NBC_00358 TaxID=2975725 RepID=UPI002E25CEE0
MSHFSYSSVDPGRDRRHVPQHRRVEPGEWPKLEAALDVVNRDVTATLPGQEPLVLMLVPGWKPASRGAIDGDQVYVALPDGRSQGNAVNASHVEEGDPKEPDDATTILAVVADAAQETVMELLWQVWPVCWVHKTGMHPRPAGTDAGRYQGEGETDPAAQPVWWCRGGRSGECHDVSPVGELAATLPGKQRRALRRGRRGQHGHP